MKHYRFTGEATNLGRFGHVRKNDILLLTDQEELCIRRDREKRFKEFDGSAAELADQPFDEAARTAVITKMTHEQRLAHGVALAEADPDLKEIKPGKGKTIAQMVADIPADQLPGVLLSAEKSAHERRASNLKKANDKSTTRWAELREKSEAELRKIAEALLADGKIHELRSHFSKGEFIHAIAKAEGIL
jgi:hypothetical protein